MLGEILRVVRSGYSSPILLSRRFFFFFFFFSPNAQISEREEVKLGLVVICTYIHSRCLFRKFGNTGHPWG